MRYKKPPSNFLVDEADIETIDYNDGSDEDMLAKESIAIAANKIFDRYKKEQTENNLYEAETINYADDTNLADVRENKNAKIAAKKVSEKYKRLAPRRKPKPTPAAVTIDRFQNPSKKRKITTKSAIITARNIAKKYEKVRYQNPPPTFLVDEADIKTIDYIDDSDEDMFAKENIVIAANKIFDRYKKEQAENNLDKAETINYVDDTNLANVRENKNAKIAAKKISEKYKRLAPKRKPKPIPVAVTIDGFQNPSKKRKKYNKVHHYDCQKQLKSIKN